ncbi:MAG: HD domain-containing phosphohydrolase [Candidatus Omnitrophota bacterium]
MENIEFRELINEDIFRTFSDITPSAIFISREKFIYVNSAIENVSGYTREELRDMYVWDVVHPDMREAAKKRFYDRLEGKTIPLRYEIKLLTRRGETVWIDLSARLIKYKGEPALLGSALDITGLKLTEEALKESLEKQKKVLDGIVNTLSSVIELRDPYTSGHQHRVSDLGCAIAAEMGLTEERIESIRIAGLLHDVGKITIPAELLSKPGKLNDAEMALIKLHPQVSYEILKKIDFPGPIAVITLQHHEKLDGSGYPSGLRSGDILPEAKILVVADIVEAMASNRPYRVSLGIEKALEEIEKNKGILYDPVVAETCLKLFREKTFSFKP